MVWKQDSLWPKNIKDDMKECDRYKPGDLIKPTMSWSIDNGGRVKMDRILMLVRINTNDGHRYNVLYDGCIVCISFTYPPSDNEARFIKVA